MKSLPTPTTYQRGNRDGLLSFAGQIQKEYDKIKDFCDKEELKIDALPSRFWALKDSSRKLLEQYQGELAVLRRVLQKCTHAAEALPDDPDDPLNPETT